MERFAWECMRAGHLVIARRARGCHAITSVPDFMLNGPRGHPRGPLAAGGPESLP